MPDLSKFLPLIDLVGRAGEETSEFKAAKANGWLQMLLFLLGIAGVVVDCATNAFAGTHLGIWLGALASFLSAVLHTFSTTSYATGQQTKKQKIISLLQLVETGAQTVEKALAENPAPATVVVQQPAAPAPLQQVQAQAKAP